MEKKREKKRQIDTMEAVSDTTKSTVKDEKMPTASETIAEIARSRPGQQLY